MILAAIVAVHQACGAVENDSSAAIGAFLVGSQFGYRQVDLFYLAWLPKDKDIYINNYCKFGEYEEKKAKNDTVFKK